MLLTAPEPPLLLGPEALDAADDVQPILKDNSAFFLNYYLIFMKDY